MGLGRMKGEGHYPKTPYITLSTPQEKRGRGLVAQRAMVTSGERVSGGAHSQTPPSGTLEINISEADGHPA